MSLRYTILAAAMFCLLSSSHVPLWAQEGSGGTSQSPPGETPRKGLDDKLLDGLPAVPTKEVPATDPASPDRTEVAPAVGQGSVLDPSAEGSDTGPQNPLQRVGRHMHQVQQRLMQRDLSGQTQQTQRQIVTELDELIAALAAQQQSAGRRRRSQSPTGDEQASQTGRQAARDSGGQSGKEEPQATETAAMRQAAGEIWGHLPERFRRQMQNAGAIEFLPKYRNLIEDYYKRLAEDRGLQQ